MKTLYVIRHCKAEGQDADAQLTPEGRTQSGQLAVLLAGSGIDRIVSSPYTRAVQSIVPLAARLGMTVETDARLIERVLCSTPRTDWQEHLSRSFDDLDACLDGGESSRAAMERAVAAVTDAIARDAQTTVLVTHGNLMTLLLRHFDPSFGFAAWRALSNPDVYRLTLSEPTQIERLWRVDETA